MPDPSDLTGKLSSSIGKPLPLRVCFSQAGYYLGTQDEEGPVSRESVQYWRSSKEAETALLTGRWTQKLTP